MGISATKGWQMVGKKLLKSWPKGWQIVCQKTLAQRFPNIGTDYKFFFIIEKQMLPHLWLNVGSMSPQRSMSGWRWVDVWLTLAMLSRWTSRLWADVDPTSLQWLVQRWPALLVLSGSKSPYRWRVWYEIHRHSRCHLKSLWIFT